MGVHVTNGADPLAELLVDADEVDRARLAAGLKELVGIDQESGRVTLRPAFSELDAKRRVLTFLLGVKASALLGKIESELVSPADLADQTGMPKGTVNPKLSQLNEERKVSKTKQGAYYVAPHQVNEALGYLRGE